MNRKVYDERGQLVDNSHYEAARQLGVSSGQLESMIQDKFNQDMNQQYNSMLPAPFAQEQMADPMGIYNRPARFRNTGPVLSPEQMNAGLIASSPGPVPQTNPMATYAQNPVMAAPQQDMSTPGFVQQQMADPTFEREPTPPETPMSESDKAALVGGLGQIGKIFSAAAKEEEAPQMKAPGLMNPNAGFLNFLSGRQEQFQPRVTRVPTPSLLY